MPIQTPPRPPRPRTPHFATALALATLTTPALAAPPDYGLDFVTVGDPGNRAATEAEAPLLYNPLARPVANPGAVGYEFRMMRNEVTNAQWVEFLNAYAPFSPDPFPLTALIGRYPDGTYDYEAGTGNYAIDSASFQNAARFCNWLHNGKVNEAWAFETGAYDTSLFTFDSNGWPTDTNTRLPGAKFWIPSASEWIKAMHYDPHKDGPNQPGYWTYPHSSDEPPEPGESDIHYRWSQGEDPTRRWGSPIGLFPDSQSPWGLLGGSGGSTELMETTIAPGVRLYNPSKFASLGDTFFDRIDLILDTSSSIPGTGFRLAAAPIPAPGALLAGFIVILVAPRTRKRS